MTEHVSQLVAEEAKTLAWLKRTGHKRCCQTGCESTGEYAWHHRGGSALICGDCIPKCLEPGCTKPVLLGGQGGCVEHEHLFWNEFQALVAGVA